MSSLRILLMLGVSISGLQVAQAQAGQADLAQRFAQCAGRMSAEMEFEWLTGGTGDQARLFRSHLEEVLEAVMDTDSGPRVLHWRIEAKHAHASLLTRSLFNDDTEDAERAARIAARFADGCRAMLLG